MTDPITTWDDESIADLISDAISNAHDFDSTASDFAKAAVKALREEGLLPSVESAEATIAACCAELTALLAERGYPELWAEIWSGRSRGNSYTVFINYTRGPARDTPTIRNYETLSALMDEARKRIGAMRDANAETKAYAAWFEWPQAEAAQAAE